MSLLLPAFPVMTLAAALPVPLIAAAPSSVSFSNPAASVLLTVDFTSSTPPESASTSRTRIDDESVVPCTADHAVVAEPAVEGVVTSARR